MTLPATLQSILQPLFDSLPLDRAMPKLVPDTMSPNQGTGGEQYENPMEKAYAAAAHAVDQLGDHPALQAAIWLYVDDLDRSHRISQNIHTPIGSFWHGIMHRREGDFSNSKYWFRQAGRVPFDLNGYDPYQFVDRVQAARGEDPEELVDLQRREWQALFELCAEEVA